MDSEEALLRGPKRKRAFGGETKLQKVGDSGRRQPEQEASAMSDAGNTAFF